MVILLNFVHFFCGARYSPVPGGAAAVEKHTSKVSLSYALEVWTDFGGLALQV